MAVHYYLAASVTSTAPGTQTFTWIPCCRAPLAPRDSISKYPAQVTCSTCRPFAQDEMSNGKATATSEDDSNDPTSIFYRR